jgi:hypothetical protein
LGWRRVRARDDSRGKRVVEPRLCIVSFR